MQSSVQLLKMESFKRHVSSTALKNFDADLNMMNAGYAERRCEGDRQPHTAAVGHLIGKCAYDIARKSASQQDFHSVSAPHDDTGACWQVSPLLPCHAG